MLNWTASSHNVGMTSRGSINVETLSTYKEKVRSPIGTYVKDEKWRIEETRKRKQGNLLFFFVVVSKYHYVLDNRDLGCFFCNFLIKKMIF